MPKLTRTPEITLIVAVACTDAPALTIVGGGDIEGAIVKSGGLGIEGLDVELIDAAGKVVGTARTDFDGFFLFERVAYGSYSLRIAKDSAQAAKVLADLGVTLQVTAEKTVVRLGGVQARPVPMLASAGPASASP